MTKTPIEPADIRRGDHVRVEWTRSQCGSPRALEYVALAPNMAMRKRLNQAELRGATWFLLDRPTPPVDLPTEPTLGWLSSTANARVLNVWRPRILTGGSGVEPDPSRGFRAIDFEITAFTPATAVPTEALDRLRHLRDTRNLANCDVDTFLAAIDEANA